MAATLQDVVNQLKTNQKVSDQTNKSVDKTTSAVGKLTTSLTKSFSMFFDLKKAERLNLDPLEAAREARNKDKSTFAKSFEAGQQAGQGGGGFNIPNLITPLLAAVGLAIMGMRGWEVPIIKKFTKSLVSSVSKLADGFRVKFNAGVDDMIRSVLKSFGINPATGKMARDARGRFTGKELKTTAAMISEAFDLLRLRITGAFGLGTDGGMIGKIVTKAGNMVRAIISPIVSVGKTIGSWLAGAGGKVLGFLDGVSGTSKILKGVFTFAKKALGLLKIVGILFSLFDGVTAFMNTEGSFMDKLVAGIAAFTGDFFGSVFDLIKDITSWALNALGFENASKWLDSFSFETIINDLINGYWKMIKGVADWIGLLFTDPGAALTTLWEGVVGAGTTIGQWIYNTAVQPLFNWFTSTFPDLSTWISEQWNAALGGAADLGDWIWKNSIGPLWDWISNTFSWSNIKSSLGLDATGGPAVPNADGTYNETFGAVPGNYKGGSIPYGKFGVVGERGPELIAGPVNVIPLPKRTGAGLQQEQYNLTQSQNRGKAGFLMANSGNTVNNTSQSSVTYSSNGMPSPFDRPAYQSYAGHGVR